MAKIMMAWELGANYGHLTRQIPIATELRSLGHEVFFAAREVGVAAKLLREAAFDYMQAPYCVRGIGASRPLVSYADLLLASGYADIRVLTGLLQAWLRLIQMTRADVVVVDHSPTAVLAAKIAGVNAVAIGSGFDIPPDRSPLPTMRPWESISAEQLQRAEELALQRINDGLHRIEAKIELRRVVDIFDAAEKLLVTFPELDHYGVRLDTAYAGALYSSADGRQCEWQAPSGPRIFAYLRTALPGFRELIDALKALGGDVICVVPDISEAESIALSSKNIRVLPYAIALEALLERADLVISTAGPGMVAQSLLSGVPMLLVPSNVDQYLQARCVESLGAGLIAGVSGQPWDFADRMAQLLETTEYRERAGDFARKYQGFQCAQPISAAVKLIVQAVRH